MLFCLYIPTFVSFGFVLCLKFGFIFCIQSRVGLIFYIQEVVKGQSQEDVDKWKTVVCSGDRWGTLVGLTKPNRSPNRLSVDFHDRGYQGTSRKYNCHLLYHFLSDFRHNYLDLICVWTGTLEDCKKWKEVEFGSEIKGIEIINAELSTLFEKNLKEKTGRELRWDEVSERSMTDIEGRRPFKE